MTSRELSELLKCRMWKNYPQTEQNPINWHWESTQYRLPKRRLKAATQCQCLRLQCWGKVFIHTGTPILIFFICFHLHPHSSPWLRSQMNVQIERLWEEVGAGWTSYLNNLDANAGEAEEGT